MPLYEYICENDGTVIELMRPMSQADAPVADPDGKGRTFIRRQSTFATGGSVGVRSDHVHSAMCGCGKTRAQGGCV
ncbi:MAG: FmdB family zinc ribbon protein [Phycisphaerales bacterium]